MSSSAVDPDDVETKAEEKFPPASALSGECSNDCSAEEKYLLAAYQEYINEAEEWPNFEKMSKTHKYHVAGRAGESLPLLIRECGRLVPVWDENSDFVKFHPLNMPKVRVGRVHIIGMILSMKTGVNYVRFKVYDGTGRLEVFYKLEWFKNQQRNRAEIDRSYKVNEENVERAERLMKLKINENGRLNVAQQRIKKFQRDHVAWWEDTRQGMLGKPFFVGSYVHVYGFCNIDLNNAPRSSIVKDNNFWAEGLMPRLLFNASDVRSMTEKSYNETLLNWLGGVFKEKYVDDKKSQMVTSSIGTSKSGSK